MPISNGFMIRRIPFLTIILSIWLILCFILEWAIKAFVNPELLFSSFGVSRSIALNGHFLRLATAAFFHVNFGHFISNFVGVIIFLTILEQVVGTYRALVIVLVSALGGTVGSIVFEWVEVMVGASTILFGVFGAIGMLILRYKHELGKYSILITIIWLINVITSAMAGYISLNNVDQGAHIGGFIAGALITLFITHGYSLKELHNPLNLRTKIILVILIAFFSVSFFKEVLALLPLIK